MVFPVTNEAIAACQRAMGFLELGMPEDAIAELDDLSPEGADFSPVRHLKVDALFQLKDWAPAAEICLQMLEREPSDPGWWIQAAYAMRRANSIEEAEIILRSGLQGHPRHGLMLYNLACYACVQERFAEACTLLSQALAGEPDPILAMAEKDPDLEQIRPWILEQAKRFRTAQP